MKKVWNCRYLQTVFLRFCMRAADQICVSMQEAAWQNTLFCDNVCAQSVSVHGASCGVRTTNLRKGMVSLLCKLDKMLVLLTKTKKRTNRNSLNQFPPAVTKLTNIFQQSMFVFTCHALADTLST